MKNVLGRSPQTTALGIAAVLAQLAVCLRHAADGDPATHVVIDELFAELAPWVFAGLAWWRSRDKEEPPSA